MGSGSSRPDPAMDEKLVERLQALTVASKSDSEYDYVVVDEKQPTHRKPRDPAVSVNTFGEWEKKILLDPKNQLALSALSNNEPLSVLTSRAAKIADSQVFNIKIPFEGAPVTNQRSSGRCWLFASTNVFRVALMRKYNLKEFQLSQAWLFFWDKIEKANYFLESIVETASEEELDGRLVQGLMGAPVGDGGQWDMVANLVNKYGLVPQSLYPDSYNAMNSRVMGQLLTTKLREDALRLRKLAAGSASSDSIHKAKNHMLEDIHLILILMLGPPPSLLNEFTWEYYDAEGKFHSLTTDPRSFAASLSSSSAVRANAGTDVHKLFSLVNDPRNQYGRLLTVNRLGNVKEGQPITYVNVPMKTIKSAVVSMLKNGLPVFFGCDVGKYSNASLGIMDPALLDYELAFNVRLGMSKAQRLLTGESQMTHAMVLTGVHVEDGRPVRWRVENSWGPDAGSSGYFVMSDEWMDQFVYQAVVDPRYVSKEVRDVLKQDPVVLPFWDPMGALA